MRFCFKGYTLVSYFESSTTQKCKCVTIVAKILQSEYKNSIFCPAKILNVPMNKIFGLFSFGNALAILVCERMAILLGQSSYKRKTCS